WLAGWLILHTDASVFSRPLSSLPKERGRRFRQDVAVPMRASNGDPEEMCLIISAGRGLEPWPLGGHLAFEGSDHRFVLQRAGDIVEAFEQDMTASRIDVETDRAAIG